MRVVIDLDQVVWPPSLPPSGGGMIASMRYGMFAAGTSRAVLDLAEVRHRLSTLRCRGVKGTTGTQASFLTPPPPSEKAMVTPAITMAMTPAARATTKEVAATSGS